MEPPCLSQRPLRVILNIESVGFSRREKRPNERHKCTCLIWPIIERRNAAEYNGAYEDKH